MNYVIKEQNNGKFTVTIYILNNMRVNSISDISYLQALKLVRKLQSKQVIN